ncbi:O-methyltransferase involved in polyketide biosynthesis [Pleurocapsa sp. PCC 7327]|uniref:class I SAM-dependent methyltransferase n=1 Tax=Pleurocapsa sp. PCC 7327 TaxID=118163 RepID=UPI00029F91F4|nr:class I SAM-dependent methyltransferase [Pleurocapsa sp. PCC 7327]AFY79162.1 O-methyltransferase involved in polyketide biosynthesis [Pleurocapsa sp. PCC 7327]
MLEEKRLSGVSCTLLFTLRARAEEHARADALFRDPRAVEWFQSLPWDAGLEDWYGCSHQIGISVRTKLLDDITARHIAARPNSLVVELGAGLSSRYYRVGVGKTQWIELDLPEVIDIRLMLDTQTSEHQFLAYSVLDWAWMDKIPGISPENILFIAEGLFYYFEESEIKQLVQRLREKFAGATLALDIGGKGYQQYNERKATRVGAPMKWFIEDERDVAALGLSLVRVQPLLDAYPERWGNIWRLGGWWLLFWLPSLRNFCLILETKLTPIGN